MYDYPFSFFIIYFLQTFNIMNKSTILAAALTLGVAQANAQSNMTPIGKNNILPI